MGWLELAGKTAVVTGASGGLGGAIARAFAAEGARVFALGRNRAALDDLAGGIGATAVVCDVAQPEAIAAAASTVEAAGGADILVNCAGIPGAGALETLAPAQWAQLLAVNLTGPMLASQAFGRAMIARGAGAIVHVGSLVGTAPQAGGGAYSVSKAALAMFSRQLAAEWGPLGVRSNVLSPALVRTPLSEKFYADEGVRTRREAMVPLRRIGRPEDIAEAVLFLASARASYITGQEILADGGLSQVLMGQVPR